MNATLTPPAPPPRLAQGNPGQPIWPADNRPGQVFAGNLIYGKPGQERMVDVYIYGGGAAAGLRYGAHPRDEETHAAEQWQLGRSERACAFAEALPVFTQRARLL